MKIIILIFFLLINGGVEAQATGGKILEGDIELSSFFQKNFDYKNAGNYRCNDFINDIFFIEFEIDKKGIVKNERIDNIYLSHLRPIFLNLIKQTNGKWDKSFLKTAKNATISIPVYYSYGNCNRDTSLKKAMQQKDSANNSSVKSNCCDVMNLFSKELLSVKESLKRAYTIDGLRKKKPVVFLPFIFIEKNPSEQGLVL